jgi:hypothetical protein
MTRPNIGGHDAITGESWEREMTEEEYADLIASGWTETPAEEATPE